MQHYDFLPDIHGDLDKLDGSLEALGYSLDDFSHPDGNKVILLGDYIDRGTQNLAVLERVRSIIASGRGAGIMGNHEMNAILYHTSDGYGDGLRVRDEANTDQHIAFLREAPLGSSAAQEAVAFMKSLPLFLDLGGARAVHACWDDTAVSVMRAMRPDGRIRDGDLVALSLEYEGGPVAGAATMLAKGPEVALPDGLCFHDKSGTRRTKARLRWWGEGRRLHECLASIDDMSQIPDIAAPEDVIEARYPLAAPPVFFGHYQLRGGLEMRSNAVCLDVPDDYSVYRWRGEAELSPDHLMRLSSRRLER